MAERDSENNEIQLPRKTRPTLGKRPRPVLLPRPVFEWGGPFEGWARGYIHKNFWRVEHHFDTEVDALQECAALFHYCKIRYEGRISEARHMMALYKTAVSRELHTWSNKATKVRETNTAAQTLLPVINTRVSLLNHLVEAGGELGMIAAAIINAPAEMSLLFSDENRESVNTRMRRIFGIKEKRNLLDEMRAVVELKMSE